MVPVPQFPFYSAVLTEYGAHDIEYFLDEENNWALDIAELERALIESTDRCVPRAIVIINPGNPTGWFHRIWNGIFSLTTILFRTRPSTFLREHPRYHSFRYVHEQLE